MRLFQAEPDLDQVCAVEGIAAFQLDMGAWPTTLALDAMVEWEKLRAVRADGRDPAEERRAEREEEKAADQRAHVAAASRLSVRRLCDQYFEGHIERSRKPKGAAEVQLQFDKMLGDFGHIDAAKVTRTQACSLLESHLDTK